MLQVQIPKSKQYSDGEVISAHRQFARKLRLSQWKPVREVKFPGFDGWKGTVAYDLDWGEGWTRESILKALFYKVVLRKPLTELRYYVLQNPPGVPANRLYRNEKLEAEMLEPILREHDIRIEVKPVRRIISGKR
jgi:hypothetical protein